MKQLTTCPHCGGTSGGFVKTTLHRIPYCFGFSGEEQDNREMYDNAEKETGGNTVYCQDCRKAICRFATLEKQWNVWHRKDE